MKEVREHLWEEARPSLTLFAQVCEMVYLEDV